MERWSASSYLAKFVHVLGHGLFSGHVPTEVPRLPLGPAYVVPEPRLGCVAGPNGGLLVEGVELGGEGAGLVSRAYTEHSLGTSLTDLEFHLVARLIRTCVCAHAE